MQLTGDAGLGSSRSRQGGCESSRRFVRARNVGAGRTSATRAARPRDLERSGLHGLRERRFGRDRRTLRRSQPRSRRTDTASRKAIFVCEPPKAAAEERACATTILSRMARLAYRRPVTKADTDTLLQFFDQRPQRRRKLRKRHSVRARTHAGGPRLPAARPSRSRRATGKASREYRTERLELASRLSFFLWSSIPDDHLLTLAEHGEFTIPRLSTRKCRRMLADPRATDALVHDFAAQWLNLRQIEDVVVDPVKYPLYDESLLQGLPDRNRDVRRQQPA